MKFLLQGRSQTGFESFIWTSDYIAHDDEAATFDTREGAEEGIDSLVRLGWNRDELRIVEVE